MNKDKEKSSERNEKEKSKEVADKAAAGESKKGKDDAVKHGDNNGAVLGDINGGDKSRK